MNKDQIEKLKIQAAKVGTGYTVVRPENTAFSTPCFGRVIMGKRGCGGYECEWCRAIRGPLDVDHPVALTAPGTPRGHLAGIAWASYNWCDHRRAEALKIVAGLRGRFRVGLWVWPRRADSWYGFGTDAIYLCRSR